MCDEDTLDNYNRQLGGESKEKIRKICDSLPGKDKKIFKELMEHFAKSKTDFDHLKNKDIKNFRLKALHVLIKSRQFKQLGEKEDKIYVEILKRTGYSIGDVLILFLKITAYLLLSITGMKIIRRFSGPFSPLNMYDDHAPWQYSWYSMMGENQSKGYKAKWFGKFINKHPGGDKEKVSTLYDLVRSAWAGGVTLPLALIHTAFKVYHDYIAGENRKDGKPGRIMNALNGKGGFSSMLMIIFTPIYYVVSVLLFGILGLLFSGPTQIWDLLVNKERHFMKWPFGLTGFAAYTLGSFINFFKLIFFIVFQSIVSVIICIPTFIGFLIWTIGQFLGDLKDGIVTEDGVSRKPPYIYLLRNLIKSKYFVAFVLTLLTMFKTQLYFQEGVMPSPGWIPSVFSIPLLVTFVLWIKSFFSGNK
tara:strand:+ start:7257 stop:8507 length:1251 start_codon:yes stop_codon:yes gene_type:complete